MKLVCIKCGFPADERHFRRNNGGRTPRIHSVHAVCIGCEQDQRDARKQIDPWLAKARSTIAHHARKQGLPVGEFSTQYGWTVRRVAHLLSHAFDNTCPYCWKAYKAMRNQLADITIDIIDPRKAPWLRTNVQPACRTCNTAKSNMSPEEWEERLRFWRERQQFIDRVQRSQVFGLPLFAAAT